MSARDAATGKTRSRLRRATLNFIVDSTTLLVALAMIATGLLIRFILPPGSGERVNLWGLGRHNWGDIHFWLAVGLVVFALIHVSLHWSWACATASCWLRSRYADSHPASRLKRNLVGIGLLVAITVSFGAFLWIAKKQTIERIGGGQHYQGGWNSSVSSVQDLRVP
jgi:hypothetical protein